MQSSALSSALFSPANIERRLIRALESPARAVIADLEDAVPPAEKSVARARAEAILRSSYRPAATVRINPPGTPQFEQDLAMCLRLRLDAIVLPKATPDSVEALGTHGPPIWALVETAEGLRLSYETAKMPRVEMLMLGSVDLASDLNMTLTDDGMTLLWARSKLVVDSRAADIAAPMDGVCLKIDDADALDRELTAAKGLGFGGKACIHPRQLRAVNAAFEPDEAELAWARRVVEAYASAEIQGLGALTVDGALVDRPVVERAKKLLGTTNEEMT